MKLYIAGSSENVYQVSTYIARARAAGIEITHDWTESVKRHGSSPRQATCPQRATWAKADVDAVMASDMIWLIMPYSFGCGVEYGIAIGLGIPRIVSGDWMSSIFTEYASKFLSHDAAMDWIIATFRPWYTKGPLK